MKERTIEDYLSEIYKLEEANNIGAIRCIDIAKKLQISKPSVSQVMKKLSDQGFVKYTPYGKIILTSKGTIRAKKVIQSHRLIEYFLASVLHCDSKDIHKEAHSLEHAFTYNTLKKLKAYLGNPKVTPDGKNIH